MTDYSNDIEYFKDKLKNHKDISEVLIARMLKIIEQHNSYSWFDYAGSPLQQETTQIMNEANRHLGR